ncbi:hypothetical protein O181_065424 [Austropuccinia psidii MF-1]|uniref:Integrase zinc-binding domain-containing protein n=1 Tax=Austropuccinia psidii MF-1 TaxID=1389203 RepID=A0A9Q3ERF1_9BASI|nr:hypothetical protein [Austropuccinia psidii MF-1]
MEKNYHILCQILIKYCKDPSLSSKLDEVLKKAYYEGRFDCIYGIIYPMNKYTCVMTMKERTLINNKLHEFHDSLVSGNLSKDRTIDRVKTCSWLLNWRKDVAEYSQTCGRCQKENRATDKCLE